MILELLNNANKQRPAGPELVDTNIFFIGGTIWQF